MNTKTFQFDRNMNGNTISVHITAGMREKEPIVEWFATLVNGEEFNEVGMNASEDDLKLNHNICMWVSGLVEGLECCMKCAVGNYENVVA